MLRPVSANKGENLFITKRCRYKILKKQKSINPKIFIKSLYVNLIMAIIFQINQLQITEFH